MAARSELFTLRWFAISRPGGKAETRLEKRSPTKFIFYWIPRTDLFADPFRRFAITHGNDIKHAEGKAQRGAMLVQRTFLDRRSLRLEERLLRCKAKTPPALWPRAARVAACCLQIFDHGVRSAIDMEFFVNAPDVGPDGANVEIHVARDLLVSAAFG